MVRESGCWHGGAKVERGRVTGVTVTAQGAFRYDVESLDRPGLYGTGLVNFSTARPETGELVYFCLFDDGTGCLFGVLG